MSAFTLTPESEQIIALLLPHGGCDKLVLTRGHHDSPLLASVCIEPAPPQLEAVVVIQNTTNSIKLQAADTANAHHLADFIEAIANGTATTAETTSRATVKQSLPVAAADMVNHPPHYTGHPSGVECIEVAEHLPFCLGNAFKYLFRRNGKATLRQDLEKALWYVNRERDYRLGCTAIYMISEEATGPLQDICAHEPAPYCYIMEMVGSGRMLDLAADMLQDQIEDLLTH